MSFKNDLISGLSKRKKTIPSKYHYDLQGSKYFEKITQQKEYYPTKKEKEILKKVSKEIPKLFKGKLSFVELGSGAIDKIKILINKNVSFYIPLDISLDFVKRSVKKLKKKYPNIKIKPIKIRSIIDLFIKYINKKVEFKKLKINKKNFLIDYTYARNYFKYKPAFTKTRIVKFINENK